MRREGKIVPTDIAFDQAGRLLDGAAETSTGGALARPTGVCVGPERYLVSDGYGNAAVPRFAPDGTLLAWADPDEPGKFYLPHSLWWTLKPGGRGPGSQQRSRIR